MTGATKQNVSFSIRAYRPEDNDVVTALFATGMLFYCPPETTHPRILEGFQLYVKECFTKDFAHMEETYFQSGGHFWVATTKIEGEEVIAAMIGLEGKGGGRGELRRLSVQDAFRGYGLARLLVAHLEEWAKTHGFHTIALNTDGVMVPARKLYDSLGYKVVETRILMEDPFFDTFDYEKSLL
ncbi:hypothetical protein Poli38472_009970 [Pythium oligandrum]|uniref:N-acetyltransferase domain-containing protein n=1 Tax=Pythium oligandrum TaxID=41045 RepID=A0A8K1FDI8_PYTOL|nr:hypothetical protein Poli38472_009970 [Pythium oligandrum]|eukprot:TMW58411.1 hypothetical protein Poli38472_009970 [Pythium oligandrum]